MALNAEDEDLEWEPPSEAEMKVLQARRERQDKISKLMGDYLLKGYKMLGECCERCETILLQDRQKKNYCVACQELDSDVDKDNPALNAQAALSQVRERQLATQAPLQVNGAPSSSPSLSAPGLPRPEHCEGAASAMRGPPLVQSSPPTSVSGASASHVAASLNSSQPTQSPSVGACQTRHPAVCAEEALLQKLRWATQELQQCTSVEGSIQLCGLIRSCADSLRSLKELQLL
ncbi:protein ZNRD2 [Scleropages formosus]|uniref:Zinc ribbon domain containing 2 n=1 Tax=Scleropages formosus TaxID=113540 RepID=A0A8D0CLQ9_SCLFO|nr:Sjoegren syndrome/scleroderma autoantigen 1 [Scleropages formosus]